MEACFRLIRARGLLSSSSATNLLIIIGDPRAVEPLIKTFSDDDSTIRERSTWSFAVTLYDARAIDPLIQAPKDGRPPSP